MQNNQQQPPKIDESGKLYEVASAQTDIRRTFREKFGWIGPEEQRNRNQEKEVSHAGQ